MSACHMNLSFLALHQHNHITCTFTEVGIVKCFWSPPWPGRRLSDLVAEHYQRLGPKEQLSVSFEALGLCYTVGLSMQHFKQRWISTGGFSQSEWSLRLPEGVKPVLAFSSQRTMQPDSRAEQRREQRSIFTFAVGFRIDLRILLYLTFGKSTVLLPLISGSFYTHSNPFSDVTLGPKWRLKVKMCVFSSQSFLQYMMFLLLTFPHVPTSFELSLLHYFISVTWIIIPYC